MNYTKLFSLQLVLVFMAVSVFAQESDVLVRSLDTISSVDLDISTETAHYRPIFGTGDQDADFPQGLERYGYLTVESNGQSELINLGRVELVYYVLGGTGMLQYGDDMIPVSKDDFFYIPVETEHGFSNPRESSLNLMVMSFPVPEDREVEPTTELQLASANEVDFQVLEDNGHGPTSSFRLLMGTTNSRRDRLASAYQMSSLYVIDFEPGGTNIPHRHPFEEEIYFLLQGTGEMVAGETADGEEMRHPVEPGDAFFIGRNALVGFYNQSETDVHARILAVRHRAPNP